MKLYVLLAAMSLTIHIKSASPTGPSTMASCSGVLISDKLVLTAAHCGKPSTTAVWVKTVDGKSYEMEHVYSDKLKDLMLIQFKSTPPSLPPAVLGMRPSITDPIYTVNAGVGDSNTYSTGVVANHILDEWQHLLVHTAAILPGASGSGLFDKDGKLVGINTMRTGGITYAVELQDIRDFLAEYKKQ